MYVHHRPFKKKISALAGLGLVWRPSEVRGPSIFGDFSFINFRADNFRAFRPDFWTALKARVLNLEANPFAWKVLIYISIDMCNEIAKNLSKMSSRVLLHPVTDRVKFRFVLYFVFY